MGTRARASSTAQTAGGTQASSHARAIGGTQATTEATSEAPDGTRASSRAVVALLHEDGSRTTVREARPPGRSYGRQFVIVFERGLEELARRLHSAGALRLLLILPSRLSWEAWRRLDQRETAAALGTDQGTVSRALRELVEADAIERRGKGPYVEWRLSAGWGWRGNAASYQAARRKRAQTHSDEAGDELTIRTDKRQRGLPLLEAPPISAQ